MFGFKKDDFSQKAITKAWRFRELIKAVTHYQLEEVESSDERDMGESEGLGPACISWISVNFKISMRGRLTNGERCFSLLDE